MDPEDLTTSLLIIAASLVASAFFSGLELAYVSANRLQIELDAKQGFRGRLIARLIARPQLFIGSMLVGNNLALVFCGIESGELLGMALFGTPDWMKADSRFLALTTQTAATTMVVLILAEYLPKSLVHSGPNYWLRAFAIPLTVVHYALLVPTWAVVTVSRGAIRLFDRRNPSRLSEPDALGTTDLDHFIRTISGRMEPEQELEHELQIMQNALEFSNIRARDCLIPRNEVVGVEVTTSMSEVRALFATSGLSKIVVYTGDIDHIIGYVHSKDLFKMPATISSVLHPTFVVPEPMAADEVLSRFIARRRHLAVVVDEFGGTSGIVTMEDLMEQLLGDIEDEHDEPNEIEEEIEPGCWRFSARLHVEDINDRHDLDLPLNDGYETLGGLVLHHAEEIPEEGYTLPLAGYILEVEEVQAHRVGIVRVRRLNGETGNEAVL
jgi:putative hemolysin